MANKILPVADALKQLYQSLGGDDPEVLDMSTNTELIQEIAKVATSGGSGLPEVTEADDGRVLGVDDGEWKAVEPSGGADIIIGCVTSPFSSTASDYTLVKGSYQDIVTKLKEGKLVTGYAYDVYDYFETSDDKDSADILTLHRVINNEYAESLAVDFFCVDSIVLSGSNITTIAMAHLTVIINPDGTIASVDYRKGLKGF